MDCTPFCCKEDIIPGMQKGLEDSKDFLGGEGKGVDEEEGLGLKGENLGGASAS